MWKAGRGVDGGNPEFFEVFNGGGCRSLIDKQGRF